jgi:hypothetical protein
VIHIRGKIRPLPFPGKDNVPVTGPAQNHAGREVSYNMTLLNAVATQVADVTEKIQSMLVF